MAYGAILGQTPTASNVTYNNSQTSSIITGTNVQQAIDQLFTSVSDGKTQIASAITDKGVSTSASDTFAQMAMNIGSIPVGSEVNVYENVETNSNTLTIPNYIPGIDFYCFLSNNNDQYAPNGIPIAINSKLNYLIAVLSSGNALNFYFSEIYLDDNGTISFPYSIGSIKRKYIVITIK